MTPFVSPPIRVGILHSLTGTMAMSESPLIDATVMAIEEINAAGGLLGRPLEPVIRDGASDPQQFAAQAQSLIETEQVATVFGCWTSLCRKAVVPIFEDHNVLLWYPVQYEGLEQSNCVFYTGLCPNQQVEPALNWLLERGRQKIYLVGSDYVFPRVAHKFIRGQLAKRQGRIVGEDYVALGETNFEMVLDHILRSQPDAIFNTLNGDSNLAFYAQYQAAGITAAQIPIMAVSVAEAELQRMGTAAVGHYACWSYFQSLELPSNQAFVTRFKQRFGGDRVTSDPIEAAYTQVYLWQQAVMAAGSTATDTVRTAVYDLHWEAPGGQVYCEANHHLRKECRIGQAQRDGQFQIIYSSDGLLSPFPWLGVETQNFASQDVVMGMLAEIPQGEQYSWELEQQSQLLEETTKQLLSEVEQRSQAEAALTAANQKIRALNASLQADKVDLEHHVQERTQDLEAAIAELKTTQTQLIQTEKMSSLGQMVAGIAHEVNNPINFIHGNVFYIRRYVEDLCRLITAYQQGFQSTPVIDELIEEIELDFLLEDIRKILGSVDMGTQRVRDIVTALRNFSRLDEAEVKAVDLHEGLNSTLLILDNRIKCSCTVDKNYGELPLVKCYPAQLNQVFTNIIVNAIDAMELADSKVQEITITTQAIADHSVQISFQDTGPGIPDEVKGKIFDPFFTTKPIGKGTGLGLGICYQIIQKHGGTIEVISAPNQGTEFKVTLPLNLSIE